MRLAKTVLQSLIGLALLFVVPFLLAGRWDLPMVWVFLGIYATFTIVIMLTVLRQDPDLLRERRYSGPNAKRWDRIWIAVYSLFVLGTWLFAILDVGRLHWSAPVPAWLQIAALFGFVAGMIFAGWALASNRFFSEVVRIQHDRGHYVVTAGPYRYVRHPGYLGNLVVWPSLVLAIGSWWALVPAGIIVLLYILRTALEDRTLQRELAGYPEYAQRVRYRLLPGIW